MSIASDMIRGHTETIILRQLLHGDSYGYQINKAIQDATGNRYELKEATLYTAFRRLEQAGCILSYWGDEAPEPGDGIIPSHHRGAPAIRPTWRRGALPGSSSTAR